MLSDLLAGQVFGDYHLRIAKRALPLTVAEVWSGSKIGMERQSVFRFFCKETHETREIQNSEKKAFLHAVDVFNHFNENSSLQETYFQENVEAGHDSYMTAVPPKFFAQL